MKHKATRLPVAMLVWLKAPSYRLSMKSRLSLPFARLALLTAHFLLGKGAVDSKAVLQRFDDHLELFVFALID